MLQPPGGAIVTRSSRPRNTKTKSEKAALLASSQNRHLQVSEGEPVDTQGMLPLFQAFLVWVNISTWKSEWVRAEIGSWIAHASVIYILQTFALFLSLKHEPSIYYE